MAGLIISQKRPRNLSHWHAGPLLFGDWGTSRLYVLGLAYASTGLAAPLYLLALSVLMIAVAWAYTLICARFPEGGGVYSAARQIHPLLSVIGGTLLLADYIVTAALSLVDAFHYFGVPDQRWILFGCCTGTIALIGLINWFGSRSAGRFALYIAVAAVGLSALIGLMSIPFIPAGLKSIEWGAVPPLDRWVHFTGIILALSGVEAVANMTGIMKEPVGRTSKKTIWPVLTEVVTLNLVFSLALLGVLAAAKSGAIENFAFSDEQVKATAVKVVAIESGKHWLGAQAGFVLGKAAAVIFALLLVSAANTVIVGMVSVCYSMSRDGELPKKLTRLNYSGVPATPLIIACIAPVAVLLISTDLENLSHLYAIGVCGAIALNVMCCALNRRIVFTTAQRAGMWTIGVIMTAIWLTIAATKPQALLFAATLVALVLVGRFVAHHAKARRESRTLPEPEQGWLPELKRAPVMIDGSLPRIMLAARGRWQAEFAIDLARRRKANLFALYVRTLRVLDSDPNHVPRIEDDPLALEALGTVATLAHRYGVPFVPIYVSSPEIVEEILDATVTYGCDTLIMGKTQRSIFARKLEGDVVAEVAARLPESVALITREAAPHPMPKYVLKAEVRMHADAEGEAAASLHAFNAADVPAAAAAATQPDTKPADDAPQT
ncbi:hypothetical protein BH11PLA1_BH11PLA1_16700 [soil metagenome]